MNKTRTTTSRDFDEFKKECTRLIEVFGLVNYCVQYNHDLHLTSAWACIEIDVPSHQAVVTLGKNAVVGDLTHLKKCALHEIIHLVNAKFHHIAECRYCTESEVEEEYEVLSVLMENVLFGKI
jgi:hypothetical protein